MGRLACHAQLRCRFQHNRDSLAFASGGLACSETRPQARIIRGFEVRQKNVIYAEIGIKSA